MTTPPNPHRATPRAAHSILGDLNCPQWIRSIWPAPTKTQTASQTKNQTKNRTLNQTVSRAMNQMVNQTFKIAALPVCAPHHSRGRPRVHSIGGNGAVIDFGGGCGQLGRMWIEGVSGQELASGGWGLVYGVRVRGAGWGGSVP
jgi:hypothetical protein